MMKILVILALILFSLPSFACSLEGKWKSHKTKTLAELYGSKVSNSEKMTLARIYGKAIVEYSQCNTVVKTLNGIKTQNKIEIIEDKKYFVILKYIESGDMVMLVKEGSCYKIPVKGKAYYEHFCRI